MISVSELDGASARAWREAADDVLAAARHCEEIGTVARDEVAATVSRHWPDEAGKKAHHTFVRNADDYTAAALALRGMTKVYDTLGAEVEQAQRTLHGALDYARTRGLTVAESGRVTRETPSAEDPENAQVDQAQQLVTEALDRATRADETAERALRMINGLARVDDPALVNQALAGGPDSPLAVALRLASTPRSAHDINVSPAQLAAVERASRETGISRRLLLAILWQEQQWYQNHDRDMKGLLPAIGRRLNWSLQQTLIPDKSLGITHMKIETARDVMRNHRDAFKLGDTFLGDLSDAELAVYMEERPNENIRLSAYYLQDLQEDPYGARTDKQLFLLYAADSPQVREYNERYGDESEPRSGHMQVRGEHWDRLDVHLDDADQWDAFTVQEREEALIAIADLSPAGHVLDLNTIYDTGTERVVGTAPEPSLMPQAPRPDDLRVGEDDPPPVPSPEPNAPPTPPKN